MVIKFRILIYLILACTLQSCRENYTYTDRYDLHLKYDPNNVTSQFWIISRMTRFSSLQLSTVKDGRHSLLFLHPEKYPITRNLIVECEQRILLPVHKERQGKVSLTFNGQNIQCAQLIVKGLDRNEGLVYSDTLKLKADSLMKTTPMNISLVDVELLNIKIEAHGYLDRESYFSIEGVNILLGETPIDSYALAGFEKKFHFPADKIVPLDVSSLQGFDKIDSLRKKKIIAIGESVHGSSAIVKTVSRFIQQQVTQNNCKLIILEIPMERTLLYNKYIRDASFVMDKEYQWGIEFEHLREWLRAYNLSKEDSAKVTILGMDYSTELDMKNSTASPLFDYLTFINQKKRFKDIDSLSVMLLEKPLKESIDYLQRHKKLQEELSPEDYKCISHLLTLSHAMGPNEYKRFVARDSVMFENVRFLIDNYCPKGARTFIYGHSGHLNRISGYPHLPDVISLGARMSRYYQDDLYSITVQVGSGSLLLPDVARARDCQQLVDLDGTLEAALGKRGYNAFFMYMPECLDKPTFSRHIGAMFLKQSFYPFNMYRRHDGILFIRDTECDVDGLNEKMILQSFDKYQRTALERSLLLNKIKKRI